MTVLSRETVRKEFATMLQGELVGPGKPVAAVYHYQVPALGGQSPVVLVLSRSTQRDFAGMGSSKFDNSFELEIQILVYDGNSKPENPLTAEQREDKVDEIERMIADAAATHQKGASYRSVTYTPNKTVVEPVQYLDGVPYLLERVPVQLEAPDA